MANIDVRRRWSTLPKISLGIGSIRRYPVIPVIILLVVLIIPSAFAGLIAPHDPLEQDLVNRLAPPAWMGGTVLTKTVVERVANAEDRQTKIPLASARQLREGTSIGDVLSVNPDLAIGDQIQIVDKVGGSWSHPFGTDSLGRDLLSRIIHGARVSLIISLIVIALSGAIGITLGLMAGFYGGWVDYVISRLIDIVMALPPILVALVHNDAVLNIELGVGNETWDVAVRRAAHALCAFGDNPRVFAYTATPLPVVDGRRVKAGPAVPLRELALVALATEIAPFAEVVVGGERPLGRLLRFDDPLGLGEQPLGLGLVVFDPFRIQLVCVFVFGEVERPLQTQQMHVNLELREMLGL